MTNPNTPAERSPETMLGTLFGMPVPIIHKYTRAQAIEDGALIQVPEAFAKEAGFKFPVALTAAAWADCVAWSDEDSKAQTHQDETARLWDVLNMTRYAAVRSSGGGRITVQLYRIPCDGKTTRALPVSLACEIGPGDNAEPVLTIMQPDED
ncbi:DUF6573 family protein [Streptomyces sp. NPDC001568]|uniref:DUF6573 family protein n=1 Tax=Streptomyces sp. NPDC001568 TaxID=3364588 RepID=UPI003677900C